MGAGKTYWGMRLAAWCSVPFVDLDVAIESGEGATVGALFGQHSEAGFRELERRYLQQMVVSPSPFVVATGGGTPCFFDNMAWMNQHGVTIYLKTPVDILAARLRLDKTVRPLLQGVADGELEQYIEQLIRQREPFYTRAQHNMIYSGDDQAYWEQLQAISK